MTAKKKKEQCMELIIIILAVVLSAFGTLFFLIKYEERYLSKYKFPIQEIPILQEFNAIIYFTDGTSTNRSVFATNPEQVVIKINSCNFLDVEGTFYKNTSIIKITVKDRQNNNI